MMFVNDFIEKILRMFNKIIRFNILIIEFIRYLEIEFRKKFELSSLTII